MEPVFHLFIPVLLLLAIYPKLSKKYIFWLALLTVILDLDRFIPGTHRMFSHSIFVALLIALVVYIAWDKKAFFVSLFYLGSHLLFDIAYPGVALFYPFYKQMIYVTSEIIMRGYTFDINFWVGTVNPADFVKVVGGESRILTLIGIVILVSVLVLLLFKKKS